MKKTIKRLLSVFLTIALCAGCVTQVFANESTYFEPEEMVPQYEYTSSIDLSLSFSGNYAYCYCSIMGNYDVTSITNVVYTLVDSNNNVVAQWTNMSAGGNRFIMQKTATGVVYGETYTFYLSANVNARTTEYIGESITRTYNY